MAALDARQAYVDGELCGVGPDGITSFSMVQLASDAGNAAGLVFFLFDLLHLDGENLAAGPLSDRKARLAALLASLAGAAAAQRSPDRPWASLSRAGLRDEARGYRLQARRCGLAL